MSNLSVHIAGDSDTGKVREHNEDRIALRPDLGLAVLADGMGGHRAGEVASGLAIQAVVDELERTFAELAPGVNNIARANLVTSVNPVESESDDSTEAVYLTLTAIAHANTLIYQSAKINPEHTGMGTTLVLALFALGNVTIAHVGDSRAYRLRDSHLERLTQDHSLIEEAVRKGMFSLEEAQRNFSKNIITRALGIGPDVDTDVQQFVMRPGDLYLLCSDGLTDLVSDADLQLALQKFGTNLDQAVQHLITLANARGGHDNISVVLALYQPPVNALKLDA